MSKIQIDGRTRLGKRVKRLLKAFADDLGDVSEAKMTKIQCAAEMTAIAEDARLKLMSGDTGITHNDIVRLESSARRAVRDLNIPASKNKSNEIDWDDYLTQTAKPTGEGSR